MAPRHRRARWVDVGDHGFDLFTADLRCEPWKHAEPHGDLPVRRRPDLPSDLRAVRLARDRGRRELRRRGLARPRLPRLARAADRPCATRVHRQDRAVEGREEVDRGALPDVDADRRCSRHHRAQQLGTRHVPGRSPWGGYDLSHTAVDPDRKVEPRSSVVRPTSTWSHARRRRRGHRSRRLIGARRTPERRATRRSLRRNRDQPRSTHDARVPAPAGHQHRPQLQRPARHRPAPQSSSAPR